MNNRDEIVLKKIIGYCKEIEETHAYFHCDEELFTDKEKGFVYRNSITMPILQIGELAKLLSSEVREQTSIIPWKEVCGMRDVFAHHYGSIDYAIVWKTSREDIDFLKVNLEKLWASER